MTDLEIGARTGPLPVVGKTGGRHRAPATPRSPLYCAAAVVALLIVLAFALAALGVVT